jgi:cytokinesis protein
MDKKLAGAERRIGQSVEQIIARFNEADRYHAAEDEAAEARAIAVRLKLEKDALEDEIAQGQDGLVGKLKLQLTHMEEKLNVSRETTSRLQGHLETQKTSYEEQIAQLEAQIMELFRMLKDVGKDVETVLDGGAMDRKTLVEQLEKNFQRRMTINILEGREGYRRKANKANGLGVGAEDVGEDGEDVEVMLGKGSLRRTRPAGTSRMKPAKASGITTVDESGRVSQFMDADDADAQEQIQQQLAAGLNIVSGQFDLTLTHFISVDSIHRPRGLSRVRVAYGALLGVLVDGL